MDRDSDDSHHLSDGDDLQEESSDSVEEDYSYDEEEEWLQNVAEMREEESCVRLLHGKGEYNSIQEMTDGDWEELWWPMDQTLVW